MVKITGIYKSIIVIRSPSARFRVPLVYHFSRLFFVRKSYWDAARAQLRAYNVYIFLLVVLAVQTFGVKKKQVISLTRSSFASGYMGVISLALTCSLQGDMGRY